MDGNRVLSLKDCNILIVDDTPANLSLLANMLNDKGCRIRPVPSGKLALKVIENEAPDLILLDINMPEMNGNELLLKGRWLASQQILTGSFSFLKVRAK